MSLLDGESLEHGRLPQAGRPVVGQLRYQQVIALVDELIAEGGLGPGSRLPTHGELAGMAGVSLITVRRALEELERAGRVTSHQGVGTFVAHARIVAEPGRSGGLLATLAEQSEPRQVSTQVLDLRAGLPRPTVARALRIAPEDQVWQIRRLRLIDGKPLVLEQALIPVDLAPDLRRRRDELEGSLYDLLARDHGLVDEHEEQYLEVAQGRERERRLLALPARATVVRLRGVSFTAQDLPFDCFEQVYPADEFVFYFAGQTARRLFRATDSHDWGITSGDGRP
jgi:DNA-binding GntR family transcriptional regulator